MILIGGPVPDPTTSETPWAGGPRQWVAAVRERGYEATYSPILDPADARVGAFAAAADAARLVIAEVGVWKNLIAVDDRERRRNVEHCKELLDLADRIGARCAVTFAGTRGANKDGWGPCEENFTDETFALIVAVVQDVIDAVRPRRAKFALETMQTVFPDSADSYVALVRAVDRDAFGVHLDPVNLLISPRALAEQRSLISDFIGRLGSRVVSCHAKDLRLRDDLLIHFDEVPPGQGAFDYAAFMRELSRLPRDIPLMLEHLPDWRSYRKAADFLAATRASVVTRSH